MFPNRPRSPFEPPRRQMHHRGTQRPPRDPFLFGGSPRQHHPQPSASHIQTVMNMFRDEEGNMDVGRMLHTAEQLNDVYKQVSPIINQFWKK